MWDMRPIQAFPSLSCSAGVTSSSRLRIDACWRSERDGKSSVARPHGKQKPSEFAHQSVDGKVESVESCQTGSCAQASISDLPSPSPFCSLAEDRLTKDGRPNAPSLCAVLPLWVPVTLSDAAEVGRNPPDRACVREREEREDHYARRERDPITCLIRKAE